MLYMVSTTTPIGPAYYEECHFINANSPQEALKQVHKSIWHNYYVSEFNQAKYEDMKKPWHYGTPQYSFYNEGLVTSNAN